MADELKFPEKTFKLVDKDWEAIINAESNPYYSTYNNSNFKLKYSDYKFGFFLPRITRGTGNNVDYKGDSVNTIRLCSEYIPAGKGYKFKINVPGFIYRSHFFGPWNSTSRIGILVSDTEDFSKNVFELMRTDGQTVNGSRINSHGNMMFPIRPNTDSGKSTYIMIFGNGIAENKAPNGYPDREVYFIPAYGAEYKDASNPFGISCQNFVTRYGTYTEKIPIMLVMRSGEKLIEKPDPAVQYFIGSGSSKIPYGNNSGYIDNFNFDSSNDSTILVNRLNSSYSNQRYAIYKSTDTLYTFSQTLYDIPSVVITGDRSSSSSFKNIFGSSVVNDSGSVIDPKSSNFPIKRLECPSQISPMDYLADKLDALCNKAFPVYANSATPSSVFPDFVNAKRLQTKKIYRVNTPGYFYHGAMSASYASATRSCINIACRPLDIDTTILDFIPIADKNGNVGLITKDGGITASRYDVRKAHRTFMKGVSADFKNVGDDNRQDRPDIYEQGNRLKFMSGSDEADLKFSDKGYQLGNSGNDDGLNLERPAVPMGLMKSSAKSQYRETYSVSIGSLMTIDGGTSFFGGQINSMIPIVPGVGMSCDLHTVNVDGEDVTFIHANCYRNQLSDQLIMLENLRNDSQQFLGPPCNDPSHAQEGAQESEGTFFEYSTTDSTDGIICFIPTLSNPSNVKPITKIRDSLILPGADRVGVKGMTEPRKSISSINVSLLSEDSGYASILESYKRYYEIIPATITLIKRTETWQTVSGGSIANYTFDEGYGYAIINGTVLTPYVYNKNGVAERKTNQTISRQSGCVNYARRLGINSYFRSIFSSISRGFTLKDVGNGQKRLEISGMTQPFTVIKLNNSKVKSLTDIPDRSNGVSSFSDFFDRIAVANPKSDGE